MLASDVRSQGSWGEIDQTTPNLSPVWGLLLAAAGFPAYALWRRVR